MQKMLKAVKTGKYTFNIIERTGYPDGQAKVVGHLKYFGGNKKYILDEELCWCDVKIPPKLVDECTNVLRAIQALHNADVYYAAETAFTGGKYFVPSLE